MSLRAVALIRRRQFEATVQRFASTLIQFNVTVAIDTFNSVLRFAKSSIYAPSNPNPPFIPSNSLVIAMADGRTLPAATGSDTVRERTPLSRSKVNKVTCGGVESVVTAMGRE